MDAEAASARLQTFAQAVLHGTSISLGSLALAVVVDVLAPTTGPFAVVFALAPPLGSLAGLTLCRARTSGKGILVRLIAATICLYAWLVTWLLAFPLIP